MGSLQLAASDDGQSFEATAGSLVVIALSENPTTGFRWTIDRLDHAVLSQRSSSFEHSPGQRIGAGGTRRLAFETTCPGETTLALKLCREWEGDSSVIGRFTVTLQVS